MNHTCLYSPATRCPALWLVLIAPTLRRGGQAELTWVAGYSVNIVLTCDQWTATSVDANGVHVCIFDYLRL